MIKLKGVTITCNYPETEVEAAVPDVMSFAQLEGFMHRLFRTEPDMTSFVIVATVDKEPVNGKA